MKLIFCCWDICSSSLLFLSLFQISLSSKSSIPDPFSFFLSLIPFLSFQSFGSTLIMHAISKILSACLFLNVGQFFLPGHLYIIFTEGQNANYANANKLCFLFILKQFCFPHFFCLALPFPNICPSPTGNSYSYAVLLIFLLII